MPQPTNYTPPSSSNPSEYEHDDDGTSCFKGFRRSEDLCDRLEDEEFWWDEEERHTLF